jgi:hypothetical protein
MEASATRDVDGAGHVASITDIAVDDCEHREGIQQLLSVANDDGANGTCSYRREAKIWGGKKRKKNSIS